MKYDSSKYSKRLNSIYTSMVARCYNPTNPAFDNYGGRGIKVCDEWLQDRVTFFEWALANGYKEDLEIDRKNNYKNYSPENCRFVDRATNMRNRRSNLIAQLNGVKKPLNEWCEIYGLDYDALNHAVVFELENPSVLLRKVVLEKLQNKIDDFFKIQFYESNPLLTVS